MKWQEFIGLRLAESSSHLEEAFAREILISERRRMGILCGVFAFGFIGVLVIPLLVYDDYLKLFKGPEPRYWLLGLLGFGVIYEFIVRIIVSRLIRNGLKIPEFVRYANALLETSIPSAAMIIMSSVFTSVYSLLTPIVLLYFLFIILSTLRLDFKLSLFTGLVAGVEYALLGMWFIDKSRQTIENSLLGKPVIYIGKGIVMVIAGALAGAVALQIKQRFLNSFKLVEERNQIISLFGQQVSQAIVDELIDNHFHINSMRRHVSVMFLDIRDFTPFAEQHTPEQIVAYLNALFDFMIESINRHHGIINQFVGDGFMATFGAPMSNGNHSQNAVNAADEIVAKLHEMNRSGKIPPTRIGIGIHCGEAVTGNVGSMLRQQYSITGNVVILASRIEQLNKQYGSELLVSHEVLNSIDGHNAAVSIGPVQVKGHEEPIHIYKVA